MSNDRLLLIKAAGAGFWYEMHHVLGQLLAAELTQRIPVVYWGKNCIYSTSEELNAFEQFFLPVSDYNINDLVSEEFTYYPQIWNCGNLLYDNPTEPVDYPGPDRSMSSGANVLVEDTYMEIGEIARWIEKGHPLHGCSSRDLFSQMLRKYVKLQPDIVEEIDTFYNINMKNRPIVAVHIRGSDKISEVNHLHELNGRYPLEIDKYLEANPSAHIFLMTDCRDILVEYEKLYGDILTCTDCKRVLKSDVGVHYQDYTDKKRKGIEIIKDTWLAARCDCFIGNGHSNVSRAISELKDWQANDIKLLY